MALTLGTRLGVYEVTAPIGEGGMGQVYRATDTRLKRQVAIKILPPSLATDTDRLARFQREAEVLASLNHPNIAAIYGVEESGGLTALVMELVEGEDLSQWIAHGPIPLNEALPIARQIAEALEAAHEQGIIHRDLKPANIKVRPDGTVKVLDFGLAKALDTVAAMSVSNSMSPTITTPAMTQAGMILGTAAYMSPEQARGKAVDRSADLWAFGCVLYEMLTGRQTFEGDDVTEIVAAIVKTEPDWTRLPASTPRAVRTLLRQCLRKQPRQRLSDARAARLALEEASAEPKPATTTALAQPMAPASRRWVSTVGWIVAGLSTVAALSFAWLLFGATPQTERPLRAFIAVPGAYNIFHFIALSPDGQRLALTLIREGQLQLYVRPLESDDLQPLAGTTGARSPFWSADSRSIAFFAEGKLKVIPATGGPARILCDGTGIGGGGTWSHDGVILFPSEFGPLRRVNAGGGSCDPVGSNALARAPEFLPDGKHFLYATAPPGNEAAWGVYLAALDEPTGRKMLSDYSGVLYAPAARVGERAHLIFLRDTTLMAQPFDETRLELAGDPLVVATRASPSPTGPALAASAAANGTLAYWAGGSGEAQLTWFDRTGKEVSVVDKVAHTQVGVTLSPDGNAVAVLRRESNGARALWMRDLERGSEIRLTSGTNTSAAVWSPDSKHLWFGMFSPDSSGLYDHEVGTGRRQIVVKTDPAARIALADWSHDMIVYTQNDAKTRADIWYMPVTSGKLSGEPVRVLGTDAVESQGQISPDGQWLAYSVSESGSSIGGTSQVYVRAFTSDTQVKQVSVDGGVQPRWRRDGRELYFLAVPSPDNIRLMAVSVQPDGHNGLRFGSSQRLFHVRSRTILPAQNIWAYSPDRGGQRFLVSALKDTDAPTINVITHWQKTVSERKAP